MDFKNSKYIYKAHNVGEKLAESEYVLCIHR